MNSEREAFKQWAQFDLMAHDFERGEHGEYLDDFIEQAWLGWQAKSKSLTHGEVEPVGAINKSSKEEYEL